MPHDSEELRLGHGGPPCRLERPRQAEVLLTERFRALQDDGLELGGPDLQVFRPVPMALQVVQDTELLELGVALASDAPRDGSHLLVHPP